LATNTPDSASQLVDRLVNDAQFRDTILAAPTAHDKAQIIKAAGYGDVSLDAIRAAMKKQAAAIGAGVQVDPERTKRAEQLFLKAATDKELQQALRAATTPQAARDVLAQAGYGDLTLDDLRAAAADLAQREELSDEELELVAGGGDLEPLWGVATWAGMGLAGAGIGFAVGGPAGAVVGSIVGLVVGAAPAIASVYVPPPSQW